MEFNDLLALVADGEFHSGEELGAALGVSRTAIWKQLQKFANDGLVLESVRGRGYRLPGGYCALREQAIRQALDAEASALLSSLDVLQRVDSTSSLLAERGRLGASSGAVCVAEQQTAGRGRLGRTWVSPFGRNLMFSILWEFDGGAAALEGLSLAVGVGVAETLQALGLAGVQLKWPNDVLVDGRKIAGVLLEMQGDAAGRCQVVIGIGVNVAMPDNAPIDQAWTDLKRAGQEQLDRNYLLAALLNRLLPLLHAFSQTGFGALRERWQALDALYGRPVVLHRGAWQVAGVCWGVADNGALKFEGEAGVEWISGGEVSIRAGATHDS